MAFYDNINKEARYRAFRQHLMTSKEAFDKVTSDSNARSKVGLMFFEGQMQELM